MRHARHAPQFGLRDNRFRCRLVPRFRHHIDAPDKHEFRVDEAAILAGALCHRVRHYAKIGAVTPEECLVWYGRAWFERDPQKRVETLRKCCTEDVEFADGAGRYHGLQEVSDMIGRYMNEMAGDDPVETRSKGSERGRSAGRVSVEVTTPVETLHGFFRYSFVWTVGAERHPGGTDFGEFADDGRMRLITVWNSTPHFPVAT